MNIVVVAGRVSAQPWMRSAMVAEVAAALAQLGHRVLVVAHSVEDPAVLQRARVCVATRREYVDHATHWPLGLRSWAAQVVAGLMQGGMEGQPVQAVLSMSRIVRLPRQWVAAANEVSRGDAGRRVVCEWLPVDETAWAWWRESLGDQRGVRRLAAAGQLTARHGGVLLELARDRRETRVANFGAYAPISARIGPAPSAEWDDQRRRVRQRLQIPTDAFVLLVSAAQARPLRTHPGLVELLLGADAASAAAASGVRVPLVLLVIGPQTFEMNRIIGAALGDQGAEAGTKSAQGAATSTVQVRLLGTTRRPEYALAAADGVAVLSRVDGWEAKTAFPLGSEGRRSRMACDAAYAGKIVIAAEPSWGAKEWSAAITDAVGREAGAALSTERVPTLMEVAEALAASLSVKTGGPVR